VKFRLALAGAATIALTASGVAAAGAAATPVAMHHAPPAVIHVHTVADGSTGYTTDSFYHG